jgi:hypothetical protein
MLLNDHQHQLNAATGSCSARLWENGLGAGLQPTAPPPSSLAHLGPSRLSIFLSA